MLLYKYRPWNKFAEQILSSNSIFYPTKETLNDLAELIHPIKFEDEYNTFKITNSDKRREARIKVSISTYDIFQNLKNVNHDETKREHEKYLNIKDLYQRAFEVAYEQIENLDDSFFYYAVNQFEDARLLYCSYQDATNRLNDKLDKFGILSLSSKNNCPVMWAHYAANHTGVVFIFDNTKDDLLKTAEKVDYIDKRLEMKLENIPRIFFMKAKEWEYEQEYRVLTKNGNCCFTFNQSALTGIVLGAKMSEETKISIIEYIENNKLELDIYQAEVSLNTFKIDYTKIN